MFKLNHDFALRKEIASCALARKGDRKLFLAISGHRHKFWLRRVRSYISNEDSPEDCDALGQIEFLRRRVLSSTPEEPARRAEAAEKLTEKLLRPQSPDAATRQMNGQTCFTHRGGVRSRQSSFLQKSFFLPVQIGLKITRVCQEFLLPDVKTKLLET